MALDFARGTLGAELDTDPGEAMLLAVRLAAGTVAYYRAQLQRAADPPSRHLTNAFQASVADLSRFAKAALVAGVDERRVLLAERAAELISRAAEVALAELDLDSAQRARFVSTFTRALARLEEAP